MAKDSNMIILRLAIALPVLGVFGLIGALKPSKESGLDKNVATRSERIINSEHLSGSKARRALRANLERDVTDLTVAEILEQLPEEFHRGSRKTATVEELRAEALLRQLGVLLGGEAITEVLKRYDGETTMNDPFSAMAVVFEGWLSADSSAAIDGFVAILESEFQEEDGKKTMIWKGRQFKARDDKGNYGYEIMQREILTAVATVDPVRGFDIFRDGLLPPDSRHLEAFGKGMGEDTDWMAFKTELEELVEWKTPSTGFSGHNGVVTAVLKGWSRWDLDAALKWGFEAVEGEGSDVVSGDAQVILAVEDRERVFEWFEQNRGKEVVTDERVDAFAGRFVGEPGTENFERLLALTDDSATRVSILEVAFNDFGSFRGGGKADAVALIEAAQLSEKDEAKFQEKVEQLK